MSLRSTKIKGPWVKFAIGLILIGGVLLLLRTHVGSQILSFSNWVRWVEWARDSSWAPVVFFLVQTFGLLGLPITLFPILGGVLFDFWVAFPIGLAACTVGSWMAFSIGRYFGRSAVVTLLRGKLKSMDEFTRTDGMKTVLFVRWFGVPPFIMANYLFGLSGIKVRDFVLGTIIGCAPWVALITYFAHSLWDAALIGGKDGLKAALLAKIWPLSLFLLAIAALAILHSIFLKKKTTPST